MSLPHATDPAGAPFPPPLTPNDYEAGGAVGSLHEAMAQRLSPEQAWQLQSRTAPTIAERAISGFSRAMGPILLVAGYYLVARFFF